MPVLSAQSIPLADYPLSEHTASLGYKGSFKGQCVPTPYRASTSGRLTPSARGISRHFSALKSLLVPDTGTSAQVRAPLSGGPQKVDVEFFFETPFHLRFPYLHFGSYAGGARARAEVAVESMHDGGAARGEMQRVG